LNTKHIVFIQFFYPCIILIIDLV